MIKRDGNGANGRLALELSALEDALGKQRLVEVAIEVDVGQVLDVLLVQALALSDQVGDGLDQVGLLPFDATT